MLAAGVRRGPVLADAAYGDETAFRDRLSEWELSYAVGVRRATTVWWGEHQPAPMSEYSGQGRPRRRLIRDAEHMPIAIQDVARALAAQSYRTLTWREGEAGELSSRFARVRVRAAHHNQPRTEEWLLIEWPKEETEPTHYWLSTLPKEISLTDLVAVVKGRWMIERNYQDLKQELGLGHFEGRNWRGFHHHASLCIAAYGFLLLERLRDPGKKNPPRLPEPPVSQGFRPRGRSSKTAACAVVHSVHSVSPCPGHRPLACSVSLLWCSKSGSNECLITQ